MMSWWSRLATLLALLLLAPLARAHKPSDSYLLFEGSGGKLSARWDIALRDLDDAVGLDSNADGAVTWGELRAADAMVKAYAGDALHLSTRAGACTTSFGATQIAAHSDGAYAALAPTFDCPGPPSVVRLHYDLLFALDAQHRGVVRLTQGSAPIILTKDRREAELGLSASATQSFFSLVRLGVRHILEGYDHLLFLLVLLLPAVLRREGGRWLAARDFRGVFADVVRIVSAFTLAHSLTLGLAAGGLISLPSRFVESAIALSVVLAALNNLFPLVRSERWLAAFGLGLLHGFGFASALSDIGLSAASFARTVFGFNLGVELGQLGVVLLLLPLIHYVRRSSRYESWGLRFGSSLVLVISSVWLVERAFDLKIIS
jgi:hypothetical protein